MNFSQLFNRICCVMHWGIGFSIGNLEQVIRDKKSNLSFRWLPKRIGNLSIADPFLIKDPQGNLNLLYEEFSVIDPSKYGKIVLATLDKQFNVTSQKVLLDTKSHSSYPCVFIENEITYVIPETSQQNKVSVYEYDFVNKCLINERVIIENMPLLDSTICKYNGRYWLFATLSKNEYDYSTLYIYYADSLLGIYKPHCSNPVKCNIDGSRPAGNIITVDGVLYRPSQNCGRHYGESISINKITRLSENEFSEEFYFKIVPDKSSEFKSGVHTINCVDGVIVIDGIQMLFKPFTKWFLFLKKKITKLKIGDYK